MNAINKFYIGIDIGKTRIKAVAKYCKDNNPCKSRILMSADSAESILRIVFDLIDGFVFELSGTLSGIGIGSFGIVDHEKGYVIESKSCTSWHDINLKLLLEKRYFVPVVVDNDVKVAAFGESMVLSYNDRNVLYFSIGTDIGIATVNAGKIVHGSHNKAGEISSICLKNDKRSLGNVIGAKGMIQTYESLTGQRIDTKHFFSLLNKDNYVTKITDECIYQSCVLLDISGATTDPDVIIIGGGVIIHNPILGQRIQTERMMQNIPLKFAKLGDLSGAFGAAQLIEIKNCRN